MNIIDTRCKSHTYIMGGALSHTMLQPLFENDVGYASTLFVNDTAIMLPHYDEVYPEFIVMNVRDKTMRLDEFKRICHRTCFELKYDDNVLVSIPVRFMMLLTPPELRGDAFYIAIPFDIFSAGLKVGCMRYQLVVAVLTHVSEDVLDCRLRYKYTTYSSGFRLNVWTNPHEEIIQSLSSTDLTLLTPQDVVWFALSNDYGLHKGCFIECDDVDDICRVEIRARQRPDNPSNDVIISDLANNNALNRTCVKIHKRLMYVPYNGLQPYAERTIDILKKSLAFSLQPKVYVVVHLTNQCSHMCLYELKINILRTVSFVAGLAYACEREDTRHCYISTNNATSSRDVTVALVV